MSREAALAPLAEIPPAQVILAGVLMQIPISKLVRDSQFNPRLRGNQKAHIERLLVSDSDAWPPILVVPIGDSLYLILDGNHRFEAAVILKLDTLQCRVIEQGDYEQAFTANLMHGLPLAIEDRKAFACWLHDTYPDLSLREIGRRCGLHHLTVKAALEGGTPSGVSNDDIRPVIPAVDRMVALALKAIDAKEGVGPFGGDNRARTLKRVINEYDESSRPHVAEALHVWGAAMQSAAQPFLGD